MTTLDRYVVTMVLRHFAYALAALLAVFVVVNLTEELRAAGRPQWGVGAALWFVVLTLPTEAYDLFPAATLLGAVLALGRMAADHELVACQAAGIAPRRIAAATLVAAALLAVSAVALGELIAAPLAQRAHAQRALAFSGGRALGTSTGLWLRDGDAFVSVGTVTPDGALADLQVFELDERRALARYVRAREATARADGWQLHGVAETTFAADAATNRRADSAPWRTALAPSQVRALWLAPRDLSLGELRATIAAMRARGQSPIAHQVAFWRRVTTPMYICVMVVLAMPIVMVSGRSVRVGERATVGALVGLGFQMFQGMFANLGIVAGFPPLVTALGPALAAAGAAGALAGWRRTR